MATISNTPRPGYVWDSTDNVWYPIGVGAHQHTNAADTPAVLPYASYFPVGKNKIINGDFAISQRGTTFASVTNGAYTLDRWFITNPTNVTVSQQAFTPGTAPVAGYEGSSFLRFAKSSTAVSYDALNTRIEDVRTLAGQTATLSFWAKASISATVNINLSQNFGSGGSSDVGITQAPYSLTTSWQRFTFNISIPSISGKTVGTSSFLNLQVFFVGPGLPAITIDVWGVQLEAGAIATGFQTSTGTAQGELAACQRYYTTSIPTGFTITDFSGMNPGSSSAIGWCSPGSSNDLFTTIQYPVPMRAAPTFNIYSAGNRTSGSIRDAVTGSDITVSNYSVQAGNNKGFNYMAGMSATTGRPYSFQWTASAEL